MAIDLSAAKENASRRLEKLKEAAKEKGGIAWLSRDDVGENGCGDLWSSRGSQIGGDARNKRSATNPSSKKTSIRGKPGSTHKDKPKLDKSFKDVAKQIAEAAKGKELTVADIVDICPYYLPETQATIVMTLMVSEGLAVANHGGRKAVTVVA